MNETQAVGTQAGGNGSDDRDREQLRRLRLNGFLRELVREEGRMAAAELLGVNYRTLVRAEESGRITGRMSDALERLLETGDDPEAERLRERVDALEEGLEQLKGGVEELATELRGGLEEIRAAVAKKADAREQDEDHARRQDGEGAGRIETTTTPPVAGLRAKKPVTERLMDPEVVTEEPAEDDADVYGVAWPLVEEWRALQTGHPDQGRSLSWLTTEERLLMLELAMLEDRGADAAAGDATSARLRAQGPDQLAPDCSARHADGVGKAEGAALGATGLHTGVMVEVAERDIAGLYCAELPV